MFIPISYNYKHTTFKVFNIPVKCDDFYATTKYILILLNNTIKIFTHNKCTNIRLYKVISHNLILFIDKKCIMNILYRILLNDIKNIEDIILYLKVDDIRKVEEMVDGFLVTYKNNKKVFYNCNLEIEVKTDYQPVKPLKVNTLIKMKDKIIHIKRDEVLVGEKNVECKKILKVVGCDEYLFIRNKEGIKALIFYN